MGITVGYEPVSAIGTAAILAGQGQYRRYLDKLVQEQRETALRFGAGSHGRRDREAQAARDQQAHDDLLLKLQYQQQGYAAHDSSQRAQNRDTIDARRAIADMEDKRQRDEWKFKADQGDKDAEAKLVQSYLDDAPPEPQAQEGYGFAPEQRQYIDKQLSLWHQISVDPKLSAKEKLAGRAELSKRLAAIKATKRIDVNPQNFQERLVDLPNGAKGFITPDGKVQELGPNRKDELAEKIKAQQEERDRKSEEAKQKIVHSEETHYQTQLSTYEKTVAAEANKLKSESEKHYQDAIRKFDKAEAEYKDHVKGENEKAAKEKRPPNLDQFKAPVEPEDTRLDFDAAEAIAARRHTKPKLPAHMTGPKPYSDEWYQSMSADQPGDAPGLTIMPPPQAAPRPMDMRPEYTQLLSNPVRVSGDSDHALLPAGATYIHPDGTLRRKL